MRNENDEEFANWLRGHISEDSEFAAQCLADPVIRSQVEGFLGGGVELFRALGLGQNECRMRLSVDSSNPRNEDEKLEVSLLNYLVSECPPLDADYVALWLPASCPIRFWMHLRESAV